MPTDWFSNQASNGPNGVQIDHQTYFQPRVNENHVQPQRKNDPSTMVTKTQVAKKMEESATAHCDDASVKARRLQQNRTAAQESRSRKKTFEGGWKEMYDNVRLDQSVLLNSVSKAKQELLELQELGLANAHSSDDQILFSALEKKSGRRKQLFEYECPLDGYRSLKKQK